MRALNQAEFTTYAQQQIEMADQMLAGHRPGAGAGQWCSCGRELPCSVVAAATATKQHMQAKLALLDATVVLPVLAPAAEGWPVPLWRRLLGGLPTSPACQPRPSCPSWLRPRRDGRRRNTDP